MPNLYVDSKGEIRHSDDVQDIITVMPSWLLRWGITLFSVVLLMILTLSAWVRYPDVVKTALRLTSTEASRLVTTKLSGRVVGILANDGATVQEGQPLAFLESTADHLQVLTLIKHLNQLRASKLPDDGVAFFDMVKSDRLGELQAAYQTFLQEFLNYRAANHQGLWIKKRKYLQHDMHDLEAQITHLQKQRVLQVKDLQLANEEYEMHRKLADNKVETIAEFRQQESKYLTKKSSLLQLEGSLISANTNKLAKEKEMLELDNQIVDERSRFSQALNSLISECDQWKSKYVLSAPQKGRVSYAGIIQTNQLMDAGSPVFYVSSGSGTYFGEIQIPQDNMGKIKPRQRVLVKLKSYPFEQFGMLTGTITYIADVPLNDSVFIAKVDLKVEQVSPPKRNVILKEGMLADAEIITEDATLLQRFTRNITKALNNR